MVDLQRKRVDKLSELNAPNGKPLGEQLEAEETIRGFHLGLMDEQDYKPPNPDMSDEQIEEMVKENEVEQPEPQNPLLNRLRS